jgi:predicted DNA-binding antitoxin AbrB/MazE fold protein
MLYLHGLVKPLSRSLLKSGCNVAVSIKGNLYTRMAQSLRNYLWVCSLFKHKTCVCVPGIMKTNLDF